MMNDTTPNKPRKRLLWPVLLIALLAFLFLGGYSLYQLLSIQADYRKADEAYEALEIYRPVQSGSVPAATGEAGETLPPETLPEDWVERFRRPWEPHDQVDERLIRIRALQEAYPDVVGWVTVPGTAIDYPIVQGRDNNYYLRRDIDGNYLYAGTPFLDSRCPSDFSGTNSVVYGHNLKNGAMFHNLVYFQQRSFLEEHNTVILVLPDRIIEARVLASLLIDPQKSLLPFQPEPDAGWPESLRSLARVYDDTVPISETDRFLTLATCTYEFDGARMVLVAVIPGE